MGSQEQVSEEGDVLYVFPKDYRSKLASKSFRIKIEPLVEKAKVLVLFHFTWLVDFAYHEPKTSSSGLKKI